MKCSICNENAIASQTKFGIRHDHCGLWSWGGAPLVSRETHEARKAAHVAFDPLWQRGGMSRSKAYRLLADHMNIPTRDCHIKLMDAETAGRVPEAAARISRT